jgi:hypothetical protein
VIGELHGVNRPDFDAEPLQWKCRRCIADVAIRDMRLDREEIHKSSWYVIPGRALRAIPE